MKKVKEADKDILGAEEYAEFSEALKTCEDYQESLSFEEANFIAEMRNNHDKWGARVFCTTRQFEWLQKIVARLR